MKDLACAILECAVPVTVTRYLKGARVKGRSEAPIPTTFTANLSVQPLNQKELQRLPEGDRAQGRVKAYGVDELKTIGTSECRVADEFEYKGIHYQIDRVDDWEDLGGYYRYEAMRIER